MFYDLHCHTGGISRCCKAPYDKIIDMAKKYGYEGMVITNHFTEVDLNEFGEEKFVEMYIEEYNKCRAYGEKVGINVLFGAEITVSYNIDVHLVIYGVTPQFLRDNPRLPLLSQKEIYEACHKYGCLLINAHPFRLGMTIQDVNYLDGVEVNCHAKFGDCHEKELTQFAKDHGLALTCGCDYHADTRKPTGGTYLPDNILTNTDLVNYLKTSDTFHIKVDDPVTLEVYEVVAKTRM